VREKGGQQSKQPAKSAAVKKQGYSYGSYIGLNQNIQPDFDYHSLLH
jgi:hypothetical protein